MLSAHYTAGHHSQHTPLHAHSGPLLSAHQAQYVQAHPISSLLPTPPSSPPTIGMHPIESTISLLESLVAFYHQERMWVYRTRAQLEMGLFNHSPSSRLDTSVAVGAVLDGDFDSPGQLQAQSASPSDSGKSAEISSHSPQTKWLKRKKAFNLRLEGISSARGMAVVRGGILKHPHTQHRARQSSNLNPASSHQGTMHGSTSTAHHPYPPASVAASSPATSFYPPTAINTATTLTSPYLSHPSFQFPSTSQQARTPGTLTPRHVSASAQHTHLPPQPSQSQSTHTGPLVLGAGGREPTVQILEMFERMMQARMESCERVTRMVREANKPGGIGVGSSSTVGGVNIGSVGGPVGGFGGPVGLPVGVGPQGIIEGYPDIEAATEGQGTDMMGTQASTQQGFPMGVSMG